MTESQSPIAQTVINRTLFAEVKNQLPTAIHDVLSEQPPGLLIQLKIPSTKGSRYDTSTSIEQAFKKAIERYSLQKGHEWMATSDLRVEHFQTFLKGLDGQLPTMSLEKGKLQEYPVFGALAQQILAQALVQAAAVCCEKSGSSTSTEATLIEAQFQMLANTDPMEFLPKETRDVLRVIAKRDWSPQTGKHMQLVSQAIDEEDVPDLPVR